MCGISGILSLNGRSITEDGLRKFNCSLAHRGPDGEGYYFDQDHLLGLAHRRLKILDMSDSGKQPMSFANDRFHITYNGEVYNFIELRRELEDLGYKFISQSDTEVVLASFHKWGIDCLKRFNGMWAFAIWDSEKRELFLARDRFGIKPLYYLHIPNCIFAFASETIAFDFLDQHVREINGSNLSLALVDSFALEGKGQTIYKNVFQVLPGHYILLKGNQDGVVQKRWWSTIENTYQVNKKYQEQCEEFYSLFESACKIRLRSDVPIGTALSGGVDSSAVYCTIQHLMKNAISRERIPENWQQAFVGIFPDTKFDERKFAEEVLNYSKGHAAFIQSDHSNLVSKLIASTRLFDSIYFSPIIAGAEIYSAMNSAGIRVSLDGHGADELLYGYPHLITSILSYARENNLKDLRKDAENTYLGLFPESEKEILMDQMKASSNRKNRFSVKHLYYRHVSEEVKAVLRKIRGKNRPVIIEDANENGLFSLSDRSESLKRLNKPESILYQNFHFTVLPTLLRNFDRAAMQSGVEIRMPFMDWRLVTFLFSLPMQSKIGDGYSKKILRDSMKGIMPEIIRTRKLKIGLNAPLPEWFEKDLKEFILDSVNSSSFIQSSFWNGGEMKEFALQKFNHGHWSWNDCMMFWPYINAHILLTRNT